MNKKDLIEMGLKNLWRRKLRTFLTVLGVLIGTSSIVIMLSLGIGLSESFKSQIESLGSLTTITVSKGYGGGMMGMGMEQNSSSKKKVTLDDKAVLEFEKIPNVVATMPMRQIYATFINGKFISSIPIKGIPPQNMELFEFKIEEGRLLSAGDDMSVVFGGGVRDSFYNPKGRSGRMPEINLMEDRIQLTLDDSYGYDSGFNPDKPNYKKYKIKTAGVLQQGDMEHDWAAYMPIKTVEKLMKEKDRLSTDKSQKKKDYSYETVLVKVNDIKNVKQVQSQIKDMGHEAFSLNDFLDEMNKTAGVIQAILGGIGAVSLLVAAIGITNTMIMSIYERTKEIGVMKVIGASLEDIRNLFLLESAIIGFFGGVFGIGFSFTVSYVINVIAPNMFPGDFEKLSIIPIWLALAGIAFSTFIGIASGYYPAKRAMNLSALEAIKTE